MIRLPLVTKLRSHGLPVSIVVVSLVTVATAALAIVVLERGGPGSVTVTAGTLGESDPLEDDSAPISSPKSCIDRSVDVVDQYGIAEPAPEELDPALGAVHVSVDDFSTVTTIPDLVAKSRRIVIGKIKAGPCGRVVGLFGLRNMVVEVSYTLDGASEPVVTFEQFDWDTQTFRPMLVVDYPQFHVGDEVLLFLKESDAPGLFRLTNFQGAYRLDGDDIVDTARDDPLVRQIESLTVTEVQQLIAPAT